MSPSITLLSGITIVVVSSFSAALMVTGAQVLVRRCAQPMTGEQYKRIEKIEKTIDEIKGA